MKLPKSTSAFRCQALALALFSSGLSAAPCDSQATPVITLAVTAAEVRTDDRTLRIQVGPEGCVRIHRPAHFKGAGKYQVQLSAAEFQQLTRQVSPALRAIDATALQARITGAERSRTTAPGVSLNPESGSAKADAPNLRFQVMDADRYVLETRLEGAAGSRLVFDGLLAYAEHYPEVPELQELGSLIGALQQLALRTDAEPAAAVSP